MKTYIKLLIISTLLLPILSSCSINTTYVHNNEYNYAIVKLPNDQIKEGKITDWLDLGDQQQITFEDGHKVFVHVSNVILSVKDLK